MNITSEEQKEIEHLCGIHQQICEQLQKRIVGLEEAIEQILIAIFSGSHALVVGVPFYTLTREREPRRYQYLAGTATSQPHSAPHRTALYHAKPPA